VTVTQGSALYIGIKGKLINGTPQPASLAILGQLPPGTTASFPDLQTASNYVQGHYVVWGINFSTALKFQTSAATPPGDYTIHVVANAGSIKEITTNTGGIREQISWTIHVAGPYHASTPAPLNLSAPIPDLARWKTQMSLGTQFAQPAEIARVMTWEGGVWYYDGARVFFQIGDYTKDPSYYRLAANVLAMYRDQYVLPSHGKVGGWRVFTQGLVMDWQRNHDPRSREAVLELAANSPYASSLAPIEYLISYERSRETAYAIDAYLDAELVGAPPNPRLPKYVDIALGHIDQWFGGHQTVDVRPFMVGLTSEALIRWYDKTHDPRVLPALKLAADWMWKNAWMPGAQAFYYQNIPGSDTPASAVGLKAPDLNLLIAPLYAWVYQQTGDVHYRDWGDQVFAGGVEHAWLGQGKQFNQNYRWAFDYVQWRQAGPSTSIPQAGHGMRTLIELPGGVTKWEWIALPN
jgi:hypothetical protein